MKLRINVFKSVGLDVNEFRTPGSAIRLATYCAMGEGGYSGLFTYTLFNSHIMVIR